jgi:hypothetical protein
MLYRVSGCGVLSSLGLLALLTLGCSSSDADPQAAGGASGTGGTGGTGADNQLPNCLVDLFADCPLSATCTAEEVNGDGSLRRRCYEGGVHAETTPGTECDNRDVKVYKADGSLCYFYDVLAVESHACEGAITTWRDSQGAVVAMGSQAQPTSGNSKVNLTCRIGETTSCERTEFSTCGDGVGWGPVCNASECAAS